MSECASNHSSTKVCHKHKHVEVQGGEERVTVHLLQTRSLRGLDAGTRRALQQTIVHILSTSFLPPQFVNHFATLERIQQGRNIGGSHISVPAPSSEEIANLTVGTSLRRQCVCVYVCQFFHRHFS